MRIADTLPAREGIHRLSKLDPLIHDAAGQWLRDQYRSRPAERLAAIAVGHIGPVFKKHLPQSIFAHHIEPAFEADEISPRLVFLARELKQGLHALPCSFHNVFTRKWRVA